MEPSIFRLVNPVAMSLTTSTGASTGATALTFTSTTGVVDGQSVTGTNIPAGVTAVSHTATAVTLSAAITGNILSGAAIAFGAYPDSTLTTLANAKAELEITDGASDAMLTRYVIAASSLANAYLRLPLQQPPKQRTFYEMWRGTPFIDSASLVNNPLQLILRRKPVTAFASIIIDEDIDGTGPLVENTDFEADYSVGFLFRLWNDLRMRWFFRKIEITYSAGYVPAGAGPLLPVIGVEMPPEIEQAVLKQVTVWYKSEARDPMLRVREQPGSVGREEFWVGNYPGQVGALSPDIEAMLDPYRNSGGFW